MSESEAVVKKPRGFAALSVERRREIASKGGKSAQAAGVGHRFTHEEAVAAGTKGARKAGENGTRHKYTHEQAVAAGKLGVQARLAKQAEAPVEASQVS